MWFGKTKSEEREEETRVAIQKEVARNERAREIPIDSIVFNPYQPRKTIDPDSLEELAASIKEVGVLQPIIVRKVGEERYELIAGERRWRAARLAGLSTIPAVIVDVT
ncbi:MAG: ParB/RepB/Spo0J family partition protein, partial [Chloroflexi bacterium]|nr:ParB/RepB/Spo0J family partition protein [Chloroflexota bacterium]